MCGICGYTGPRRDGVLEAMTDSLRHRGPDDEGFHYGDGVALGVGVGVGNGGMMFSQ